MWRGSVFLIFNEAKLPCENEGLVVFGAGGWGEAGFVWCGMETGEASLALQALKA